MPLRGSQESLQPGEEAASPVLSVSLGEQARFYLLWLSLSVLHLVGSSSPLLQEDGPDSRHFSKFHAALFDSLLEVYQLRGRWLCSQEGLREKILP